MNLSNNRSNQEMENKCPEIEAKIAELRLGVDAKFIPWSQRESRDDDWQCVNWEITLYRSWPDAKFEQNRRMEMKPFQYRRGVGHIPKPKILNWMSQNQLTAYDKRQAEAAYINEGIEKGKSVQIIQVSASGHVHMGGCKNLEPPPLRDILHCVIMDSSVLNYSEFEEWANEYGYDTDSRRAEKIYQACLKQSLRLRSLIPESEIQILTELFQDY